MYKYEYTYTYVYADILLITMYMSSPCSKGNGVC